jgi:hypothetical protein
MKAILDIFPMSSWRSKVCLLKTPRAEVTTRKTDKTELRRRKAFDGQNCLMDFGNAGAVKLLDRQKQKGRLRCYPKPAF